MGMRYRVVFLTGPPLKMSLDWPPPKMPRLAPPLLWKSSKYGGWERGDSEYFNIFNTYGGPVWDSNFFLKSVTYWPTLSKFRGGPVKKTGRLGYRIQLTVHTRFQRNIYSASCKKCSGISPRAANGRRLSAFVQIWTFHIYITDICTFYKVSIWS